MLQSHPHNRPRKLAGGIPAGAKPSDAVTAFIAFLHGPTAVAAIKAKGMQVD